MRRFTITRVYSPLGTRGVLSEGDTVICRTIERPRTGPNPCIPEGTYRAVRYDSPKHGPRTWELVGVAGRTHIQIHSANWPHELLGCFALGYEEIQNDQHEPGVAHSRAATAYFYQLTELENEIEIEIRS